MQAAFSAQPQPTKQQRIDTYIKAKQEYDAAVRACELAGCAIGAASARIEMHWWPEVHRLERARGVQSA